MSLVPENKRKKLYFSSGIFLVVAMLVLANVWLAQRAFSSASLKLPRLNFSLPETASLLGKNPKLSWSEPKNILVLGKSGGDYIAPDLTDTIMIVRIDPVKNPSEVKLVSVPRDLLVAKKTGYAMRINALWLYGQQHEDPVEIIKKDVEKIIGFPVDRLIVFDLETARKMVDRVGGVTVHVSQDIYDTRFPTKDGGYETFSLQKGWRYLSAADALRFARTRATKNGDFDRIINQQELLRSLKGKIASLNPVWNFGKLWSVFNIVKKEVVTDLSAEDVENILAVGEQVSFEDIEVMSINSSSGLLKEKRVSMGDQIAEVLVTSGESDFDYTLIQEEIGRFLE